MPRPRSRLYPPDLTRLRDLTSRGYTIPEIAIALGFVVETMRRAVDTDPRAQEALAEGVAKGKALAALRARAETGDGVAASLLARHEERA